MKLRLLTFIFLLSTGISFAGCSNDGNYLPDAAVIKAFEAKYPEAARVEWEQKNNYQVAEFHLNGQETEAWFDKAGNWVMTETDIVFKSLPEAVQTTFNGSEYKTWKIEDIDQLERAGMAVVYIIEAEQGEQEFDLYYAEDGTLIKSVADNGNTTNTPEPIANAIQKIISEKYPNARILEIDQEKGMTEVDIMDGNIHKEVIFDSQNNWISTSWEVRQNNVEANVMDAFNTSEFKTYRIDDIDFYETPSGSYYLFELESNPDIYITIGLDGTITKK